jgi:RNA polymerase sigma-70 factor, ECF subfamily
MAQGRRPPISFAFPVPSVWSNLAMARTPRAGIERFELPTRPSLIARVKDLTDAESWSEFYHFYQPLLMRYLRHLGMKEDTAHDLIQDVFIRLLHALPAFELSNSRGRFRSYLWKLTYSALVDRARRVKVRQHAEEEWVKRFKIGDESEGRKLEKELDEINHQRFLEMSLARVRTVASATAWTCFEERLLRDRPASAIAGELGISVNAVFVYASRVLKMVRHQCTALSAELGDENAHYLP